MTKTHGRLLGIMAVVTALGSAAQAAEFSTSFEGLNQATVGTFSITDSGLTTEFSGGTAFTIGNGALYNTGVVSWMLDPVGVAGSNGQAIARLMEPATELSLFVRNEPGTNTNSRVQFLDGTSSVLLSAVVSDAWQQVALTRMPGQSEITRVVLIHDGGTGMAAIDDLTYTAEGNDTALRGNDDDDSSGSAMGVPGLLLLLGLWLVGVAGRAGRGTSA